VDRYQVTHDDRFSQNFDLTFDLSVFDMFAAWERGACVCCPPRKTRLNPRDFIRNSDLTIWFSTPSVAWMMKRMGSLKPGAFPRLRWSLFCGEPLPLDLAIDWAEAAPHSALENLYGPTETTVACTAYPWNRVAPHNESSHGIVPIGYPLPGVHTLVVNERLAEVSPGQEGELLIAGPQVSLGYWRDPEKTSASFLIPPGKNKVYYRTGDLVYRPRGGEPMRFLGRLDNQIKVLGNRVELLEIEALLRRQAGVEMAIALGWPLTPSGASGTEAFVSPANMDVQIIRARLAESLPGYAVPRKIHLIDEWPLNANGKIDRQELVRQLEVEK
jgi:non-ribosomal peptide synthetase component F